MVLEWLVLPPPTPHICSWETATITIKTPWFLDLAPGMPLRLLLHVLGGGVWALGTSKCFPSSEALLSPPISWSGKSESRYPGKSNIRSNPMALFLVVKEF